MIVTPGGRGAGVVALDKMTGKTVWASKELSDGAGYSSPIVADVGGVRTIMTFTADAGVGRSRVRRQVDVAKQFGRQRNGQHRHAGVLGRQGVLHLVVRNRCDLCSD